ncbi:MAG: tetratricopeptide repeat protein [Isosphaeraceae bacterium]
MRGAELYDRVVNWPGPLELTAMFGAALVLIMLAALLLSFGRLRTLARTFGVIGVVTILVALFLIHEQTVKERVGEFITVTRYRYPASTRFQIRVALLGLPAASALVMGLVLTTTRRRLRSTVPDHLKGARRHLVQGDLDSAMAEVTQALKISPYLGEAYFQRGCIHEAKGEMDAALADFDQALACDPQHAISYLHRGRLRTTRGDLDGALADFDQVMIMRPNDPECFLNRGVCLAQRGIISDAILDFQRVLKLTNHSDYADPARYYLEQLGGENPLPGPAPSTNGSHRLPSPADNDAPEHDYVL